jgi:glycosyltransferase involved in cell wall biosynthesis
MQRTEGWRTLALSVKSMGSRYIALRDRIGMRVAKNVRRGVTIGFASLSDPLRGEQSRRTSNHNCAMRVGLLTASVSRLAGGMFEACRRQAQSLEARGDTQVEVLGLEDAATKTDLPTWYPLKPRVFPVRGPRAFGYSPAFLDALLRSDFDLVETHGLWMYPSVATLQWHRHTARPYLVHPHGHLDGWAIRRSRWKKRVASWLYQNAHLRQAACIRALCEAEAKAIRAYGLRNPICQIPNGVELPAASSCDPPPWAGSIPSERRVLLYLGRLHPQKNVVNLLRAWREIQQGPNPPCNDWALVVAGWSQNGYLDQLRAQAQDAGLGQSVLFLGPLFGEAKAAALTHATAFVLPSFSEGLPMAVLEAWAYGKPVLMTPECHLPEGFEAGAALRIQTDPESIAQGLQRLFKMRSAELTEMGNRGRDLVAQRFSWDKVAAQMRAVYDWLLNMGPRPECVETTSG